MSVPQKSYSISFDKKPEYLYAHVTCNTFTEDIALAYLSEVLAECRELQYKKILIQREIPVVLPSDQTLTVASKLAELDIADLKIAVADPLFEKSELDQFSSVATRGCGIRVRLYMTAHEARRWLLYGD